MQGVLAKQANKGGRPTADKLDKISCQVIDPKEKHKAERQNKTDYKIAKAADTSEDTGYEKAPFYTEKAPTYSKKVPCASCCGVTGKHFLSLVLDSARNLSGFSIPALLGAFWIGAKHYLKPYKTLLKILPQVSVGFLPQMGAG